MKYILIFLFSTTYLFISCSTSKNDSSLPLPNKLPLKQSKSLFFKDTDDFSTKLSLNWNKFSPEYYEKVEFFTYKAFKQHLIRKKTAKILVFLHKTLTKYRIFKLHNKIRDKKYFLKGEFYGTREIILKYLDILENYETDVSQKQKKKLENIVYALAKEIERLQLIRSFRNRDIYHKRILLENLSKSKIFPSDSSIVASEIIGKMLLTQKFEFPINIRLMLMKKRIENYLKIEIKTSICDWSSIFNNSHYSILNSLIGININFSKTKYNSLTASLKRKIYLKKIFQKIKDKKIKPESIILIEDLSINKTILKYQQSIAKTINYLFLKGEISSDLVFDVSKVLDLNLKYPKGNIIYLKHNAEYYLKGLLKHKVSLKILKYLSDQKVFPFYENFRGAFYQQPKENNNSTENSNIDPTNISDATDLIKNNVPSNISDATDLTKENNDSTNFANTKDASNLNENQVEYDIFKKFKYLYESKSKISFPEDKMLDIHRYMLPFENLPYRLKLRRIARILIKLDIATYSDLKYFELVTGIQLLGVIKN